MASEAILSSGTERVATETHVTFDGRPLRNGFSAATPWARGCGILAVIACHPPASETDENAGLSVT